MHFGNRNGAPSTQDDVDKVLKSLNDLSLTITTGGETAPAAGAEEPPAETANAPMQTKTINVNVELLKFGAKKNAGGNTSAGEGGNANVNGEDGSAGNVGEGGASRIESVDTTTV